MDGQGRADLPASQPKTAEPSDSVVHRRATLAPRQHPLCSSPSLAVCPALAAFDPVAPLRPFSEAFEDIPEKNSVNVFER